MLRRRENVGEQGRARRSPRKENGGHVTSREVRGTQSAPVKDRGGRKRGQRGGDQFAPNAEMIN